MIQLALLRHGVTLWNRAGRIQGRTDIPLADDARDDLSRLCLPEPWDRADLWSSPLIRATETARLVTDREPKTDAALIEMDWGTWEGAKGKDLLSDPGSSYRHIEDWGWDYRPPSGESPADLWARLEPWLSTLERDTVAVCHIGVMRVILARAHGWAFRDPAPFRIKRNRLFVVTIDGNQMAPLPDPVRLIERGAAP